VGGKERIRLAWAFVWIWQIYCAIYTFISREEIWQTIGTGIGQEWKGCGGKGEAEIKDKSASMLLIRSVHQTRKTHIRTVDNLHLPFSLHPLSRFWLSFFATRCALHFSHFSFPFPFAASKREKNSPLPARSSIFCSLCVYLGRLPSPFPSCRLLICRLIWSHTHLGSNLSHNPLSPPETPSYPGENVPFPSVSICSNNRISTQTLFVDRQVLSAFSAHIGFGILPVCLDWSYLFFKATSYVLCFMFGFCT